MKSLVDSSGAGRYRTERSESLSLSSLAEHNLSIITFFHEFNIVSLIII